MELSGCVPRNSIGLRTPDALVLLPRRCPGWSACRKLGNGSSAVGRGTRPGGVVDVSNEKALPTGLSLICHVYTMYI